VVASVQAAACCRPGKAANQAGGLMYNPVTLWWLASTATELADLFAVRRTAATNCREVQDRVMGILTMDWLILRW